jgi:hypothetical protein
MEKANIINFTSYRETQNDIAVEPICMTEGTVSQELEEAIGQLIQRLRDANPIQRKR